MKKNNDTDLLVELVRTNFKLRYNNSLLGFVWVLLKPFFTFLVLYVIFSNFRGNGTIENYTIYLLCGVILYGFINEGIIFGLTSLLDKASIILKVNFNKTIAVLSSEIMALINFFINLLILAGFILFNPVNTNAIAILYFFFNVVIIALMLQGVSFFTSIILVKFRDLKNIAELLMQLLFYGSAIFYPLEQIPARFRWLIEYNPIYILINSARTALISGEIVSLNKVLILFVAAVFILILGNIYFKSAVKKVAESF